jgi:hypothetical protein
MTDDFNAFLMGGGTTSAKFATPGTSVTGVIDRQPEIQQQTDFTTGEAKFWGDGKPMQQMQVVLKTAEQDGPDDEGLRAIYVKGNMQKAVRDAVRASGARGLEVGGTLTVTYTGDGESTKRGMNPPKVYTASYTPAAANFLSAPEPASEPMPEGADPQAWAAYQKLDDAQKKMFFPAGFAASAKV